jgi:putative ABC transport system permease protein
VLPRDQLALGLDSLRAHRLRSSLSILGVVFGVAAVVAMASIGEGARRETLAQIEALGLDTFALRPKAGAGALPARLGDSLSTVVPGVVAVAPIAELALTAEAGERRFDATALGTTPEYAETTRLALARGRFLADLDGPARARVAVLGAVAAWRLFPLAEPLGQRFRMGPEWYTVVGVLHERASPRSRGLSLRVRDLNTSVLVPLPALRADSAADEIVVRLADGERVVSASEVARALVLRHVRAEPEVTVPREILRQRLRAQRVFDVVTGAIAAIGLLVGGIGIMNVMLAAVAERTREVGVRRVSGATRRDVAAQFLLESSLLTAVGAALGTGLGILAAHAIQGLAGWPTALSAATLGLALLMALATGLGFGLYPALRAARLEPAEALRAE